MLLNVRVSVLTPLVSVVVVTSELSGAVVVVRSRRSPRGRTVVPPPSFHTGSPAACDAIAEDEPRERRTELTSVEGGTPQTIARRVLTNRGVIDLLIAGALRGLTTASQTCPARRPSDPLEAHHLSVVSGGTRWPRR